MKIDYEYIDVFKKRGNTKPPADKEKSAMTKKEWFDYFLGGIWDDIQPIKQKDHPAMFPEEIPRRLIKMFSFVGDIVFDPFAGSGTTLKVAIEEKRIAIGQEIGWTENWKDIVHNKINQDISFIQMPGG
jgi:DNA modification methylase